VSVFSGTSSKETIDLKPELIDSHGKS